MQGAVAHLFGVRTRTSATVLATRGGLAGSAAGAGARSGVRTRTGGPRRLRPGVPARGDASGALAGAGDAFSGDALRSREALRASTQRA